jgi:SAM-dependent methyltransferase
MIQNLERVRPPEPGKPHRPESAETQRFAQAIAAGQHTWTPDDARDVGQRFDAMAGTWDGERGGYRPVPMADALERGGPWPSGLCLELGAGTGLLTPLLTQHWPRVLGLDLSEQMLARNRHRYRARADAARLPLRSGAAAAVAIGDAPLFAAEVLRVLAPGGVIVWSNALGADAPFHVPAATLVAALSDSSGREWHAVTSEAGWGSWAVMRG